MIPEKPDFLIARVVRRATLKWRAGENLLRDLQAHGADAETTKKAMNELADALRTK